MNINIYQIHFEDFFVGLVPVGFFFLPLIKLTALIAIKKNHVFLNNVLFGLLLLENIILI